MIADLLGVALTLLFLGMTFLPLGIAQRVWEGRQRRKKYDEMHAEFMEMEERAKANIARARSRSGFF